MPMPLTLSNPEAALVNLSLDAVALCNEGANSRAHILLTKRKEKESMPTSFEELLKALNPEQAETVNKHIAGVEAAKDGVIKGLNDKITELTGKVETLEKAKPAAPATDDVLKNASPEIKAMVEKLQGTVNSLVAEREEDLAKSRYEKVKALPVEEAELKGVLKSASPAVLTILEKAATAIAEVLAAKGKETPNNFPGGADDAYNALEKSAKAIMGENTGMTFEQAFTKACEKDPTSYAKYAKGEK